MAPCSMVNIQAFRTPSDEVYECLWGEGGSVCVRVSVRAHGASALNKVTEFSLALPLYTVQFSWRASPRCVSVCVLV